MLIIAFFWVLFVVALKNKQQQKHEKQQNVINMNETRAFKV